MAQSNSVDEEMIGEIEENSHMTVSVTPASTRVNEYEVKVDGAFSGYYTPKEIRDLHEKVTE